MSLFSLSRKSLSSELLVEIISRDKSQYPCVGRTIFETLLYALLGPCSLLGCIPLEHNVNLCYLR